MATGVLVRGAARPRLRKKTVENVAAYLALAFFLVLAVFPVFWMLMTSFKSDRDLVNPATIPFWFQQPLTLDHYVYLFSATKFTTWLGNTLTISACVVLITLAVCLPAAYALARLRFFGLYGRYRSSTRLGDSAARIAPRRVTKASAVQ